MNLHLDIGQIGLITTISIIGRVAGSLIGGISSDRWGRKRTLIFIIITTIIFSALLIYVNTWQLIAILYGILGILNGALFTNLFAICMDITAPEVGATQFSILMSLLNFGELGGESISGTLISQLGFGRTFLYAAWILGPGLLILRFIKLKPLK
jgi:MFS family permease